MTQFYISSEPVYKAFGRKVEEAFLSVILSERSESKDPYWIDEVRTIIGPFDSRQKRPLAQGDTTNFRSL